MIHFLVPAAGKFGIDDYLAKYGVALADRVTPVTYEELPTRTRFERGTWILAGLERLGPASLALVTAVHSAMESAGGFRTLNHPTRTLRRFELITELHRRGLNDFRAMRASRADLRALRYPVFLRTENAHDGAMTGLLKSAEEVEAAIGNALVHGHALADLLVVEFCDTSDADGCYRKYAAFVVGDRVVPRSLAYGKAWMLKHSTSSFTRPMVEEELAYVSSNPHAEQLREVFRIAGAEYGRIDYALKDGRVQTWEINLNPTIGRGLRPSRGMKPLGPELEAIREETKGWFYRGFEAALREVDAGAAANGAGAIEVGVDRGLVRAALAEQLRVGTRRERLVEWLRPVKPVLAPIARVVLPVIGRVVRRG